MSSPVLIQSRLRLGVRDAVLARLAAGVALALSHLPPRVICRVLTFVVKGATPADPARVSHWRTAVNSVSTRCAGNGCLQRSVAVVLLARVHGQAPTWRTGVRFGPFVAHAWVEAGGAPVDEPAAVRHFHIVLEVAPEPAQPREPGRTRGLRKKRDDA